VDEGVDAVFSIDAFTGIFDAKMVTKDVTVLDGTKRRAQFCCGKDDGPDLI
jgi:hypothetical protein